MSLYETASTTELDREKEYYTNLIWILTFWLMVGKSDLVHTANKHVEHRYKKKSI